jgi:hypothetical protein
VGPGCGWLLGLCGGVPGLVLGAPPLFWGCLVGVVGVGWETRIDWVWSGWDNFIASMSLSYSCPRAVCVWVML